MTLTSDVDVDLRGLGLRYEDSDAGAADALAGIDLHVPAGTILGLLGRNGSGKTSLMSLVASLRRPPPARCSSEAPTRGRTPTAWPPSPSSDPGGDGGGWKVHDALEFTAALRPAWDEPYARRLLDRFEVPNVKIANLSRGKRAALACTMGLAARAPVTMFDEAHLGMDAPSRYAFYDEVLSDYLTNPRTVILSTHHIDEVASLFGRVAILDRGRLLVERRHRRPAVRGTRDRGPRRARSIGSWPTVGVEVLHERRLGGTQADRRLRRPDRRPRRAATAAGIDAGPDPPAGPVRPPDRRARRRPDRRPSRRERRPAEEAS